MAAGPETGVESPDQSPLKIEVSVVKSVDSESVDFVNSDDNNNNNVNVSVVETKKGSDLGPKSEMKMQEFVDMLSSLKLNPMAKEFFPSYSIIDRNRDQSEFAINYFVQQPGYFKNYHENGVEGYPNNRRRRNSYSNTRRLSNGRTFRAQREDSIKRTVYVSDIDHNVTEEQLAALFSGYGHVLDCRVCGDPHSRLRFAFVEFGDENSARAALNLGGTMLGFSQITVLPSKTAILPVNPTFLPRSEDEREMCARTVYCTNIDKKVSQTEVKNFFETRCGEVSRLRLLGDNVHSTRIAFVEFVIAESAIVALDCCGQSLGAQPIRVSPSKTPVRPKAARPLST
ncbi:putative RNA recognition motif domain, ataxin-2, RNA-binding domain superfamily [Helianthus annuus]|nr:putative RNA recognition motif domain, ataxin-2, RNA-binding domain superfamily [Helianthus annuus]KAJ0522898.1 putative RNA recognition motif domain, ataxin-2, RNA-binding domain superfamily [Helianthus annuus]KAJ0697655.1 putative RNA recognition motif domain, ataxin-2, RNA-binding domain superfamily [Helianthus annuus]KAJ0880626.1 putative RNA recognition motif domain, ataxin-2, RNA-binding domain superfamily [Helianthus annuus]